MIDFEQVLTKKYSGILDIDNEINKSLSHLKSLQTEFQQLKQKYSNAKEVYQTLLHEINLLKDDLDISEYGVYEPHFDFDTSEQFKTTIKTCKSDQKEMIKSKSAIIGGDNWTVNGSKKDGNKMTNHQKKLMLRAFNGECDSFISSSSWNNMTRLIERIEKSFNAVNKMGEVHSIEITRNYLQKKLQELRLNHEYKLKKHEEKIQEKEIKERIREEAKAVKEYEKTIKEAKKNEDLIKKAYEKAKQEAAKINATTEDEKRELEAKLLALENQLHEAIEKGQRAISMAQQTKAGHVYVISNVGSFGENVYKIGMTRRLEPMDRVRELGGASVPFRFDLHAMIYSENAPELEKKLHKHFNHKRLNRVNLRREFFRVSLDEIIDVVTKNYGIFEFIKQQEAIEYRESLALAQEEQKKTQEPEFILDNDDLFEFETAQG